MMTLEVREQVMEIVLKVLHKALPRKCTIKVLRRPVELEGYHLVTEEDLYDITAYLLRQNYVEQDESELQPGMLRYRITPQGVDYLAREGLISE